MKQLRFGSGVFRPYVRELEIEQNYRMYKSLTFLPIYLDNTVVAQVTVATVGKVGINGRQMETFGCHIF